MFDESNIIVGLEIGTSKVCAVVGEQSDDGSLNIVGLGQARSRGVRKGEIADAAMVEEGTCATPSSMPGTDGRRGDSCSVYWGAVTGGHIRGFNNRGVHPVVSADREISKEDVQDVVKNAKAINLPAENTIIHAGATAFSRGFPATMAVITDPQWLLARGIEVDMHVVHGNTNRLQNAIRLVKGLTEGGRNRPGAGVAARFADENRSELASAGHRHCAGTDDYVSLCRWRHQAHG